MKAQRGNRGISTLSLTSALDGGGWLTPCPEHFTPGEKRPGTHCTGGWVGPKAGLNGCGKPRPRWDSILGSFSS